MATVQEVKNAIQQASQAAGESQVAMRQAVEKLDHAIRLLQVAADGSGHEKLRQAGQALRHAKDSIGKASQAVGRSSEAANSYVSIL